MPVLKLDTVASDILGASGRAIIKAIITGQEDPDWLADHAKGTLRGKRRNCAWPSGAASTITTV